MYLKFIKNLINRLWNMKLHDVKTIFICIIYLVLFSAAAYGQEFLFKVIALSGKVTYQKGTAANWENIKTGDKIFTGEKLKLEAGDYLGLISNKGRSLEIKQAGIYNATDLNKNIQKAFPILKNFIILKKNKPGKKKKKKKNRTPLVVLKGTRGVFINVFF